MNHAQGPASHDRTLDATSAGNLQDDVVPDPTKRHVRTPLGKGFFILMFAMGAGGIGDILHRLMGLDAQMGFWIAAIPLIWWLTRIFRGRDESDGPRPWWKLTARSTASLMLGGVPGLWLVISLIWVPTLSAEERILGLICLIPCVMYLHSWFRLRRRGL